MPARGRGKFQIARQKIIDELRIQFPEKTSRAVKHGLMKICAEIIQKIRDDMNDTKTGEWYRWLPNRSSAPISESPASQSGKLENSFYYRVEEISKGKYSVVIGNSDPVSSVMEYGSERVLPRKFIRSFMAEATFDENTVLGNESAFFGDV